MVSQKRKSKDGDYGNFFKTKGRKCKHPITVDQNDSPLFKLPEDLRKRIYKMVCQDITITWPKCSRDNNYVTCPKAPALILVCKQDNADVLEIFYANATFAFASPQIATRWMGKISDELQSSVRSKLLFATTFGDEEDELRMARQIGWDKEFRRMTVFHWNKGSCQVDHYVYRLEYNAYGKRAGWVPPWPDIILRDYMIGTGATRRSNVKILAELDTVMSQQSDEAFSNQPTTNKLAQANWDRSPHGFCHLWSLWPKGQKVSESVNAREFRTGPVI
ncbi:unnamed protein product [Zymoseptoria tritici ST99CH_3D1]|nr:unnamed protein product [Zymoseptoria tritici ST99CH_3D1]